ncbi:hypothetical protein OOK13_42915 [Streptomyces sp. NBC_00378]|uniref:hypothetical protein n=1 Tax=unclassified Streptomyces TaxID=2593676 RepID=UPI00224CF94E|nr:MULTISPECIES: hypothetical protein [unclassified Streptomyces]MCX5115082.1 hypothetical protein [Streptomyces sp. NBC_00378]
MWTGTLAVEQAGQPAVAQHVQIVDAVRTGHRPVHDRQSLRVGGRPGTVLRAGEFHLLNHQGRQAAPLGRPDRGDRPGMRDQAGASNAANSSADLWEIFTYEVPCCERWMEA